MDDKRILAGDRKIWVIKAGFPNTPAKIQWSDYVFAHTMKKYLERLGYYVVVESKDEWKNDKPADVIVSLRGPYAYYPDRNKKDCIYILWNLSHPSTVTDEEYNAFDLVCIGSEKKEYLQEIQKRVHVPVKSVPMCVDTEIFYPDTDPFGKKEYDWVFVGNSRYKERKSVTWAIKRQIPLKIWGAGWKNFIPESEKYVVDINMPNNELPDLYRNARITIDDHYEDMINNGFINTRVLESLACGLPIISDYSEVLTEMFGDAILCYRNEEEFGKQIERLEREYSEIKEKTMSLCPLIREKYSFESIMKRLSNYYEDMILYADSCQIDVKDMCYGKKEFANNSVGTYYREWKDFLKHFELENSEEQIENQFSQEALERGLFKELEEEVFCLRKRFCELTWQEQEAFYGLSGREGLFFHVCILDEAEHRRQKLESERVFNELYDENVKLKAENEKTIAELETVTKEKKILEQKRMEQAESVKKAYEQKREINEKLQRTYAEKSEINRKLQITYGEKYERGLEIKRLKKELDSIKKSRSYKLARIIGLPVRLLRNLIKKFR